MSESGPPDLINFAMDLLPSYLTRADSSRWAQALRDPTSIIRIFFNLGREYERVCQAGEAYRTRRL